jgi:hypothetical protein
MVRPFSCVGLMYGLDHLGIAKYGKVALDEHPEGWALGAFSSVFGDALPAVKAILDSGRCPRVRLQLHWEDDHKEKRDTFRKIQREAIRVGNFLKPYAGRIDCRVSGFCEHTLNAKRATELKNLVMKHMPAGVTYVNSIWTGALLPGVVNEVHGSKAKVPGGRYDFSYDGQSCFDADVESHKAKYSKAETFYFWFPQCNGRMKAEDKTPRPQRKAWPTSKLIDSAIYLSTTSGVSGKLPKSWILKTHSDQHTVPPGSRDCIPVIIAPIKVKEIQAITRNGQVVANLAYYGPFTGGGFRYYAKEFGYILAEKAKRIQGDPVTALRVNGKKIADVNLGFRAGTFR